MAGAMHSIRRELKHYQSSQHSHLVAEPLNEQVEDPLGETLGEPLRPPLE
jgi:hypothetical protein